MDGRVAGGLYDFLFMIIFSPLKRLEEIVTNFTLIGSVFSSKRPIYREKIKFLGWFIFR